MCPRRGLGASQLTLFCRTVLPRVIDMFLHFHWQKIVNGVDLAQDGKPVLHIMHIPARRSLRKGPLSCAAGRRVKVVTLRAL